MTPGSAPPQPIAGSDPVLAAEASDALQRGQGVALWQQIEQILEGEILAGGVGKDGRIPTENDLVRRFRVNRHTVRRALAGLQDRGLIRIEQGRGSFLQENVVDYVLGRRVRFSENLTRQQRSPAGALLRAVEVPADETVAAALEIPPRRLVVVLEIIGESDDQRLCIGSHYFEAARFPGLAEAFARERSISRALRQFGITDYERRVTRITARMPSSEDARYLHQPKTRPVLVSESVNVTPDGRPVEYGLTRFASDRVQFVVER